MTDAIAYDTLVECSSDTSCAACRMMICSQAKVLLARAFVPRHSTERASNRNLGTTCSDKPANYNFIFDECQHDASMATTLSSDTEESNRES